MYNISVDIIDNFLVQVEFFTIRKYLLTLLIGKPFQYRFVRSVLLFLNRKLLLFESGHCCRKVAIRWFLNQFLIPYNSSFIWFA